MEKKYKKFICVNLPQLISLVNCSKSLLNRLRSDELIGIADVQQITCQSTELDKSSELIELVQKKFPDAYKRFINALEEENQTGAASLLKEFYKKYPTFRPGRRFQNLSQHLHNFLFGLEGNKKSILLLSHDLVLSKERIEDCSDNRNFDLTFSEWLPNDVPGLGESFPGNPSRNVAGYYCFHRGSTLAICLKEQQCPIVVPQRWTVVEEVIRWSDLTEAEQSQLMERKILFQRKAITLGYATSIVSSLGNQKSSQNILNMLDTGFLVKLLTDQVPDISDKNIAKPPENYITRSLVARHRISRRVLNVTKYDKNSDIFVFQCEGLQLFDLLSYVEKHGDGRCRTSGKQIERRTLSANAILLQKPSHFDKICKRAFDLSTERYRPVHLLECICEPDGKILELKWIKSVGSILTLQKYLHQDQTNVCETSFHTNEYNKTRPIIISDSPGMGKSYLLSNCAIKMQANSNKNEEFSCIHIIAMKDIAKKLFESIRKNSKFLFDYPTEDNVLNVLADSCSDSALGKAMIRTLLHASKEMFSRNSIISEDNIKFEIMLDGIDELQSDMYNLANYAVTILSRAQFPFYFRLWVTTRPHLLPEIEETLGVLGHSIVPFDETQQANLLTSVWTKGTTLSRDKMKAFATNCLQRLNNRLPASDEYGPVVGNPLLCTLLADIHLKEAQQKCTDAEFDQPIPDLTITMIYEEYTNKRLEFSDVKKEIAYLNHIEKAFQILFPENSWVGVLTGPDKLLNDDELLSYGIIVTGGSCEPVRFIHNTFTEYFAAVGILKIFDAIRHLNISSLQCNNHLERFEMYLQLIRNVFAVEPASETISKLGTFPYLINTHKFTHPNVQYFLNHLVHLDKFNASKVKEGVLRFYQHEKQYLIDWAWNCLFASTLSRSFNVAMPTLELLEDLLSSLDIKSSSYFESLVPFSTYFYLCAKFSDYDTIESVCKMYMKLSEISKLPHITKHHLPVRYYTHTFRGNCPDIITPLHVAMEAGNFKAVHYLLTNAEYGMILNEGCLNYAYLLHVCLENSRGDTKRVINEKKDMIKWLVKKTPGMLKNYVPNWNILLEKIHIELLIAFLKLKTEIAGEDELFPDGIYKNKYGENFLHLLASGHYDDNLTPKKYHDVLDCLHGFMPKRLQEHLIDVNGFDWRAIDVAASTLDLLKQTFSLCDSLEIDFKLCDYRGRTILSKAVAGQRDANYLQKLINRGATCMPNSLNATILHSCATYLNFSAAKLFVNELKQDVNAQDMDGNTPLHRCFGKRNFDHNDELTFDEIHKLNTDPVLPISRHFAHKQNSTENLETKPFNGPRIRKGTHSQKNMEQEPSNQHKIIKLLIENGAQIDIPNSMGITPFHLALDICLGGLAENDKSCLQNAGDKLFSNPMYMTLALKGLLCNSKLGYLWHPSLILSFADELRKHGGDVYHTDNRENASILHMAAKAHSLFGIEYLIKHAKIRPNVLNNLNQTPLQCMGCSSNCKIYNCSEIKQYLDKALLEMRSEFSEVVIRRPFAMLLLLILFTIFLQHRFRRFTTD